MGRISNCSNTPARQNYLQLVFHTLEWLECAQEVVQPRDARLLPKIHVNLGITLEGDGRLLAACDSYR